MDGLGQFGSYGVYALAIPVLWALFGAGRWLLDRQARSRLCDPEAASTFEPVSLHPVIDPARCVGCGACTHACPEGRILGLIDGKARLLDPGACIGHGACKTACPVGAIDLVFGTARRGVEIPVVSPAFESTIPGIFIAGELGGMGLIANAIEQGRQAMNEIAKLDGLGDPAVYDVVIVGGGPAGISASLAATERRLRFLTFEQESIGGTVARYPRGKLVMTRPADLPLYGKVRLRRVRKERLLALWQSVFQTTGLVIYDRIRVEKITPITKGFEIATSAGSYRARSVLLATGRRGAPRRLGVTGEELAKVVYSLADPAQYEGSHVLVVGGGDSALEAATTLARYPVASVTVSYRGERLTRARPVVRQRFEHALEMSGGRLRFMPRTRVRSIEQGRVLLVEGEEHRMLANDRVIVCIGGLLPMALLADVGVATEMKFGAA